MTQCDSNSSVNDVNFEVTSASPHDDILEYQLVSQETAAEVVKDVKIPIDEGWAWAILVGCTLICTIIIGVLLSHGIFLYELVNKYDSKNEFVNWIFGLFGFCHNLIVPIANNLSDVLSTRLIVFTGALLICAGFFLSSFVNTISVYFITYGIIAGLGNGLTVFPAQILLNKYFQRYRVFANGVMLAGGPLGTIIIPTLINYLIFHYSLRGMFLIMSAVTMNLVVAAALLRPINFYVGAARSQKSCVSNHSLDEKRNNTTRKHHKRALVQNIRTRATDAWNVAKNKGFLIFTFALMCLFITINVSLLMLPSHMILNLQLDQNKFETSLLIYGVSTLFGRLSASPIADRKWIQLQIQFFIAQTIVAFCAIFITITRSFTSIIVFCVLLGVAGGQCTALYAPVFVDELGLKNLVHALSLMPILHSPFQFTVPIFFGFLRDTLGDWLWCYRILSIFNATSALLILIYVVCKHRCKSNNVAKV